MILAYKLRNSMRVSSRVLVTLPFLVAFAFVPGYAQTREYVPRENVVRDALKGRAFRIAVLPLENLSGKTAPLKGLREVLFQSIIARPGISPFGDEAAVERFMDRHRVRYVGGIDAPTAKAFKDEEGVDAVLVTALELYQEEYPPKIGIISRLVSTGDTPHILWMESVTLAGDESPGILALGMISDPEVLADKAFRLLVDSLTMSLSGEEGQPRGGKAKRRYGPKVFFQKPFVQAGRKYTVAVAPFFNESLRKDAGEILLLHFVEELVRQKNLQVIEPGVIRTKFLNIRVIMYEGISLSDADAVLNSLNADLILTGKVIDYEDQLGELADPKIDFSVLAIQGVSKKLVWASKSYNRGNDGVFFFDQGKIYTAGTLASDMARGVVDKMFIAQKTEQREGAR